jgi:general secretion pathway protein G
MVRNIAIGDRGAARRRPRRRLAWRRPLWPRAADAGWTLVELLVVVSLIMILATIGLAQYRNSVTAAREAVLKEDLFRMRDAIDQYYADKGEYPASLDALVSEGYLREIPVDPFTRSRDTWQTILAEPDPNNPTAAIGIYDVKSGSDQTALNGTKYSEW